MADRRSDDSPVHPNQPPRATQNPTQQPVQQPLQPAPAQRPTQPAPAGPGVPAGQRELTERINAAYASSAPVLPDDTDGKGTRSTGDKFAAVLAKATQSRDKPAKVPAPGASPAAAAPTRPATGRRVRKARLRLTHVDPWSVMKTAFLLAVALGIVVVVAVGVVWSVLGAAGVWDSIDRTVSDVVGETGEGFRVEDYLGMNRVMGFTMIVAVVDVVLVTVIATLGAFLYNLAAALLGGIEVVLAEEDR